ncbi:MAG: hypothetical protein AAFU33_05795 [Bacteroidota bacterium]
MKQHYRSCLSPCAWIIWITLVSSCQTPTPEQNPSHDQVKIEAAQIVRGNPTDFSCENLPGGCVHFDIQYPHIAQGKPMLKLAVYQWSRNFVLSQMGQHTLKKVNSSVLDTAQTLVELIDDFFVIAKLDLEEIKKEPTLGHTHHSPMIRLETGFQILHNTGRLLTLQLTSQVVRDTMYQSYQSILTFDTAYGTSLTWEQVTDQPQVLETMITLLGEEPLFSPEDLTQSYPYTAILDTGLLLYHQKIPNQWAVEVPMLPQMDEARHALVIPQETYQPFVKDIYLQDLPSID